MTLDEIRAALKDRRPKMVAEATGIHYQTIRGIRDGRHANPSYKTMQALAQYLSGEQWQAIGDVAAKLVRDVEAKRK